MELTSVTPPIDFFPCLYCKYVILIKLFHLFVGSYEPYLLQ
jgi:hypothetical protein